MMKSIAAILCTLLTTTIWAQHPQYDTVRERAYTGPNKKTFKVKETENICGVVGEPGLYTAEEALYNDPNSKHPKVKIQVECKNKKIQKIVTEDGESVMTEAWLDGIREGRTFSKNKNGKLKYEVNFKKGVKEGEEKTYYDDGALGTVRQYKNGQLEGEQKDFHPNGKLRYKFVMKNGNNVGKDELFDENGKAVVQTKIPAPAPPTKKKK